MLLGLFVVEYFHLRCKWILLPALANYYQVYLQGYLCIVLLVLAMVKQAIVATPPNSRSRIQAPEQGRIQHRALVHRRGSSRGCFRERETSRQTNVLSKVL
jgi:hypothetical protein